MLKSLLVRKNTGVTPSGCALLLVAILSILPSTAFTEVTEPFTSLRTELMQRTLTQHPSAIVSVEFTGQKPLQRACISPTAQITGQKYVGRIPIRVRCAGKSPWSYYTYAQVDAIKTVIAAAHPIARGRVIQNADLILKDLPVSENGTYFDSKPQVLGQLASRAIQSGQALQTRHVKRPLAIKRGDRVTIQARHGNAVISAGGTAMRSGHVGEQIPVRNTTSERIIHTWITAKGVVSTRASST